MFSSDFFEGNRSKLQQELGEGLVVLGANGLLQRSADTTFSFRQDSNFWYLTGIDEPDYVLVIDSGSSFLIEPKRADHRDLWDGAIGKKELKVTSGIQNIKDYHDGWNALDKLLKKKKKVYTITPAETYIEVFGFFTNPARSQLLSHLSKHRKLEMVDIRHNLARLRQLKQPPELAALKKAINLTTASLSSVKENISKYKNEAQINGDITRDLISGGASGHAYQPIIAAGKNATTIHYMKCNSDINQEDLILLDVGAEYSNYSADITRTYSASSPTKRQQAVHESVATVHQEAINLLKPGLDMKEYEQKVDAIMAKQLKKLKLIDDIKDRKKLKKYYPHLTSHFLGLDTHDSADYKMPLQPGVVLTVEPGIYIPDEGIGVRLEDDVLITENGVEILSDNLARELI